MMATSTGSFQPALVEVKPEYVAVFQSLTPIELEVWSDDASRLYQGQIVSIDETRVILSFQADENPGLIKEAGNEAAICHTAAGELYRGECKVLAVTKPGIVKVVTSRPHEVSRTQLRSSFRWDTRLEHCRVFRAPRSEPSNWQGSSFTVSNISTGGIAGHGSVDLDIDNDDEPGVFAIEIAFPWGFGVITLPLALLSKEEFTRDGEPAWRYRGRFIRAPQAAQDTITRYVHRSEVEVRLRGSTGPSRPEGAVAVAPAEVKAPEIEQRRTVAERLAVSSVDADEQQRLTARARKIGHEATELAREIVLSPAPHNIRRARPFVDSLLRETDAEQALLPALTRTLQNGTELYVHSVNVTVYSLALGYGMGYDRRALVDLGTAAFLHDIGMTAIPEEIVQKPGPLTPYEWVAVRRHPHEGRAMAARGGNITWSIQDAIVHHQERCDGSGYPDGLQGEQISEPARILAVADVFDALTVDKPWRSANSLFRALKIMRDELGPGLDPAILRDFILTLGQLLTTPETP